MQRIWKSIGKVGRVGAIVILLVVFVLVSLGIYQVRRSFPQESGTLTLAGLHNQVMIRRDRSGVPHLYAHDNHDLFMAQGYVHAQDRFWQMDFWRHIGAGRLAEMFGESQVKTDRFLRTMGWARVAQQEVAQLDGDMKMQLEAYATGVNAYLESHQGTALSLEYGVLKLLNPAYRPEPWRLEHSLTWSKVMSYDLSSNLYQEIQRTVLLKTFSLKQVEELYPPYPIDHPTILPDFRLSQGEPGLNPDSDSMSKASPAIFALAAMLPDLTTLTQPMEQLHDMIGEPASGIGSNNWVISGQRTTTGKPLLADDPHLAVQMPSIWYEVGLHCQPKGEACPYDVVGFSFAGMLGVVIGHNDRIAWGVTNVAPDVMDLYIEKVNPQNPNQYEVNGKWVDMQSVPETIQVAGSQPILQTVRYTRHGPVLSDINPNLQQLPDRLLDRPQIPLPPAYVVALRWTALEPGRLHYAIPRIDRARNWPEFRAALQDFQVPAQNFVYADVEGNIGYQTPGHIPIRNRGNGRYPVPGWTTDYDWQDEYIPFEKLPYAFNPPQGYLSSANDPVAGQGYPFFITTDWNYGYRAKRIADLLASHTSPFSLQDLQKIQGDNFNLSAQTWMPLIQQLQLNDRRLETARNLFQDWDFQLNQNSAPATLFEAFWKHLLADTFQDQLSETNWLLGDHRAYAVVNNLLSQPDNEWWDDRRTPKVEQRDDILKKAFADAVAELEQLQGKNPNRWRWGKLHPVTFRNATLGKSGIAPIERLFNRGPYPTAGNGETVNANRWHANKSYEVTDIPSLRMIVDLANLDNSLAIHAPGQSGHAFHKHYADLVDRWRHLGYNPMWFTQPAVTANTASTLTLLPSDP